MPDPASLPDFATHKVENQPPPLGDFNAYTDDGPLRAVCRRNAPWADSLLLGFGGETGSIEVRDLGRQANRNPPQLQAYDRYGWRIDRVDYHPAYHQLMDLGVGARLHCLPWAEQRPGAFTAQAALIYLLTQAEPGVCCPLVMTFASLPALEQAAALLGQLRPKLRSTTYDARDLHLQAKGGITVGMALTEKQGGSDLRGNTTRALPTSQPNEYALVGHKWFCSAPMSDGFLCLARAADGLTCFWVPRWIDVDQRNRMQLQRLKDKLGNRANASAEVEFQGALGYLVGEPGRGIATVMEMVQHTRLDTAAAPAGLMRAALREVLHHLTHRKAFGGALIRQPLMVRVLADLALEAEAATLLFTHAAAAYDGLLSDDAAVSRRLARLLTPIAKFANNKVAPGFVAEAMECLGGGGYVEDSPLPLWYREAPLNGIWEGSGNVICLDLLRALSDPQNCHLLNEALRGLVSDQPLLRPSLEVAGQWLAAIADGQFPAQRARALCALLARLLQAGLLLRHGDLEMAEAFARSRLSRPGQAILGATYGLLPDDLDCDAVIARTLEGSH